MLFAPVSTGPWITLPAGSANLPVTSAAGFVAGQKIGIDIGGNYELATVTAIGNAATQTVLSVTAMAGATNIKVATSSDMTAGDTLTVGTGKRKELATIASVGSAGTRGTGIGLAAPLHFNHMAGVDLSDAGTGISFVPATRFPHISGDAVQALGSGIVLDRPLEQDHSLGAPVVNFQAATVGYQDRPAPNRWFGVVLSSKAGSIALQDAGGTIVDALVYGSQQSNSSGNGTIASPEFATLNGDQGKGGCIAVAPGTADGDRKSLGRFPDGRDTGSNCTDFLTQAVTTLSVASVPGMTNIKVASVADFYPNQAIMIDAGANSESAVIATVGTAGATTVSTATEAGKTVIPVVSVTGLEAGQTVTIGSGADSEKAVIASVRWFGTHAITVTAPTTLSHTAGVQISGTGITLTTALTCAHASGATAAGSPPPTPGAPNQYYRSAH
jgi:sRNA-binding protein